MPEKPRPEKERAALVLALQLLALITKGNDVAQFEGSDGAPDVYIVHCEESKEMFRSRLETYQLIRFEDTQTGRAIDVKTPSPEQLKKLYRKPTP